jgi:hypothetical protein
MRSPQLRRMPRPKVSLPISNGSSDAPSQGEFYFSVRQRDLFLVPPQGGIMPLAEGPMNGELGPAEILVEFNEA